MCRWKALPTICEGWSPSDRGDDLNCPRRERSVLGEAREGVKPQRVVSMLSSGFFRLTPTLPEVIDADGTEMDNRSRVARKIPAKKLRNETPNSQVI